MATQAFILSKLVHARRADTPGNHSRKPGLGVIWDNCGVRDYGGRKLDRKTLEALRLRVVDRVQAGAGG